MVGLPHLVRRLGAREARQLHDAAHHEHQVADGVLVQEDLVTGQLPGTGLIEGPSLAAGVIRKAGNR